MQAVLKGVAALAVLAAAGAAFAQTTVVAPTAAQRCLTRGEVTLGAPTYPQQAFERRDAGRVAVELDFDRPDAAPRMRVTSSDGGQVFEDAVHAFVAAYRVPCLEAGQRVQLLQEFVFRPSDGRRVVSTQPIDADGQRRSRMHACLKHLRPSERITYPALALSSGEHGTVVLKLEFVDPQSAPRVTVLDSGGNASLTFAARRYAIGFRIPCLDGGPVDTVQFYIFKFEGDARVVLTDTSLAPFLRSVKGIQKANVYFDFNTMGCPFEFHMKLFRPHGANRVGELGDPNPERRFFLDWLQRQELDFDAKTLNAALGQEMTVSVPCTVLNLGTTSGGSASQ
jgi:hypothetical protein